MWNNSGVRVARFRGTRGAVAALAVAAVAVLGLTACESNAGTAARVGDDHISSSDVNEYLTPKAKVFTVQGQQGAEQRIVPRSYVLTTLIQSRLFSDALAASKGGRPTQTEIDSAESQARGNASDKQLEGQFTHYGFTASFAHVTLRNSALEYLLAKRVGATTSVQPLIKAINDLHLTVQVSARYGKWNEKQFGIDSEPTAAAPSFVKLHVAPSAPGAAPQQPQ
jgi:hypothetical protein